MVIDQQMKSVTGAVPSLYFSIASSAVHILSAMVERDFRMVSVRRSVGPSYWGTERAARGPESYTASRVARWDIKESIGDCGAPGWRVSVDMKECVRA